jgi:hypothetical protein
LARSCSSSPSPPRTGCTTGGAVQAIGLALIIGVILGRWPQVSMLDLAAAIGLQLVIVVLLVLATRALPSFSTATTSQVVADA